MESKRREQLRSMINEMLAVETLEYHNKNLLSGDNKTRCEWRQDTLKAVLIILDKYKLDE